MTVDAAVVTASAAVIVAVVNQVFTWRQARSDREYERRRGALLDVQDAALDVRRLLRLYGDGLTTQVGGARARPAGDTGEGVRVLELEDPPSTVDVDHANGLLDVRAVRLDRRCRDVTSALGSWRDAASDHFLSPRSEARARSRTGGWPSTGPSRPC